MSWTVLQNSSRALPELPMRAPFRVFGPIPTFIRLLWLVWSRRRYHDGSQGSMRLVDATLWL